jgi:hypothetical protein
VHRTGRAVGISGKSRPGLGLTLTLGQGQSMGA